MIMEADQELLDRENASISKLFGMHLLDWCDGPLSAQRLRDFAIAGLDDGFEHPMCCRLASVGESNHAHAGVIALLEGCGVVGKLSEYPREAVTHALMPSTWMRIISQYPHEFKKRLGANRVKLRSFWADFLERPANADIKRNHPVLAGKTLDELEVIIPIVLHTDAAPFTKVASCNCVSVSGLLGAGDEKLTKYLVCSHVKDKDEDPSRIWCHIIDDCLALGTGVVDGVEVAREGDALWKFAYLFQLQDEETRCNEFGLSHYNAPSEQCSECLGNRTSRPLTDLLPGALWRPTERMPLVAYKARVREPSHPLVDSPFFCHRFFFGLDLMHMMDCKGSAGLSFGGALVSMLQDERVGNNQAQRMATINDRRMNHYDGRPGVARLPKILLANVWHDGWADLHGPAFKAAITRQAAPFFRELVCHYCSSDAPLDECLRLNMSSLDDMYRLLYEMPLLPSDADLVPLRIAVQSYGTS
jgi:hypothetical protein